MAILLSGISISLAAGALHIIIYIICIGIIGFAFNGFEIVNFVYIAEISSSLFLKNIKKY